MWSDGPGVLAVAERGVCSASPAAGSRSLRSAPSPPPPCHRFKHSNKNLGDGTDYGQRHHECLGELISDTLQLLEQRGGPDAYINIK